MRTSDFDFQYPEALVATQPQKPSRILLAGNEPKEINKQGLIKLFQTGDVLVINETKVIPKKISALTSKNKSIEVLFLNERPDGIWTVLLPLSRLKPGEQVRLPGEVTLEVVEGGIPQGAKLSRPLDLEYFLTHGQMPLPPYIEKARKSAGRVTEDMTWYQTAWALKAGSAAAPTASFHFDQSDLETLKQHGVQIEKICLHVGLGTFLPVQTDTLSSHKMHAEYAEVPASTWAAVSQCKGRVWALGTTVCRTLESIPKGKLHLVDGSYKGETDIFIYPGFQFEVVNALLTNFHQPKSTLLALVSAFSDLERVKKNYQWAIEREFRLFSYGDLSVWLK